MFQQRNASGFLLASLSKTPRLGVHVFAQAVCAEEFPIKASDFSLMWIASGPLILGPCCGDLLPMTSPTATHFPAEALHPLQFRKEGVEVVKLIGRDGLKPSVLLSSPFQKHLA